MSAMKMNCLLVLVAVCGVYSQRSTSDILRKALGHNPITSHRREPKWIPQNVNVVQTLGMSPPSQFTGVAAEPDLPAVAPPRRNPSPFAGNSIVAGRPTTTWQPIAVQRREQPLNTKPIVNNFGDVKKSRPARKNRRRQNRRLSQDVRVAVAEPEGRRFPPVPQTELSLTEPKDVAPVDIANGMCEFSIPSFLLPDPTITQVEFEQTLLMPALRAVVRGPRCNSRALNIYLDWLLHLRQRLFNV